MKNSRSYIRIPLIYLLISAVYIVLSGVILDLISGTFSTVFNPEVYKGLGFVAVTTFLLWYVLYREYTIRTSQELRFQKLVESIDYGVVVLDVPDLKVSYANPAFCELFRVRRKSLADIDIATIFDSPQTASEILTPVLDPNKETESGPLDLQLKRADCNAFPARLLARGVGDPGNTNLIMLVISDLSKVRAIESRILEHQSLLDMISKNVNDVFWIKDLTSRRNIFVSSACESVLGITEQQFYSSPNCLEEITHPEDREFVTRQKQSSENQSLDIKYRIIKPNDETRWVRERLQTIEDSDGVAHRIIGFLEDITDPIMRDKIEAQSQRLEAIVNLTDGIAHDFNNFLLIIQSNSELLAELVAGNSDEQNLIKQILQATDAAVGLTKNLLVFARAQRLEKSSFDPVESIHRVIQHCESELALAGTYNVDSVENMGAVYTDRKLLEAGLINMIRDLTEHQQENNHVIFQTESFYADPDSSQVILSELLPGDYVVIKIIFPEKHLPDSKQIRSFEPFFIPDSKSHTGFGLGLSMTHGLLKQSDGAITLESSASKGTTISLFLPSIEDR